MRRESRKNVHEFLIFCPESLQAARFRILLVNVARNYRTNVRRPKAAALSYSVAEM